MKTELIAKVSWGDQPERFVRSTLTKDETMKGHQLRYQPGAEGSSHVAQQTVT